MNYSELDGKSMALLIFGNDEEGKGSFETFKGKAIWDGEHLLFDPDNEDPAFPVPEEFLENIAPVGDAYRDHLQGSEYMLPFHMNLSEEDEEDEEENPLEIELDQDSLP